MPRGFLAYIIPVEGDAPTPPGGGQPVYPSHPIVYPPEIWPPLPGGRPPGGGGGAPVYPSHPIVYPPEIWPPLPGGRPPGGGLGTWGPNDPRPSNPIAGIPGLPGWAPPPVINPTPPSPIPPGGGSGGSPIYPTQIPSAGGNWYWAYSPSSGWTWVYYPKPTEPEGPTEPAPPVVDNTLPTPPA
jgi:hypothetical protein